MATSLVFSLLYNDYVEGKSISHFSRTDAGSKIHCSLLSKEGETDKSDAALAIDLHKMTEKVLQFDGKLAGEETLNYSRNCQLFRLCS